MTAAGSGGRRRSARGLRGRSILALAHPDPLGVQEGREVSAGAAGGGDARGEPPGVGRVVTEGDLGARRGLWAGEEDGRDLHWATGRAWSPATATSLPFSL